MKTQNPDFRETARAIFHNAPFIADLGLFLADLGPGWCETVLPVAPKHLQQDGYVHAGVQATMADHTAKTMIVAESEIYAILDGVEKLAAKATVTLAPVQK